MTRAEAQAKPAAMIYLIRHGQTEFNREGRFQGQCDSPLTGLGRDQAARVGARLAGLIDDPAGWRRSSSPLGRAADTARIVQAAAGLAELKLEPRLAEISMGSWDGLTEEEIAMVSPDVRVATRYDLFFASPDGEGYDAIAARLQDWLDEALAGCFAASTSAWTARSRRACRCRRTPSFGWRRAPLSESTPIPPLWSRTSRGARSAKSRTAAR